jgi:hypothetical protein
MDLETLISQTEALSWEDPSSQIETNLSSLANDSSLPLVGTIISQKTHNNQATHAALNKAWAFAIPFSFAPLGPNKFLFKFSKQEHIDKILKCPTWNVNGCLLILTLWSPKATMKELSSTTAPFWIQIHGMPLENMTIKNAVAIGKGLGSFLKVDDNASGKITFRSYLRVLIEIKVLEPLKPGFYFKRDNKEPLWISFIYERLDFYCTLCGKIGHKQSNCCSPETEHHPELYSISLKVNIFSNLPSPITPPSAWGHDASVSRTVHPTTGQTSHLRNSTLTPTILKPLQDLSLLSNQPSAPLTDPHTSTTSLNAIQTHLHSPTLSDPADTQDPTPKPNQTLIPKHTVSPTATNYLKPHPTSSHPGSISIELSSFNPGPKALSKKKAHPKNLRKPISKPITFPEEFPPPTNLPNFSKNISSPAINLFTTKNPPTPVEPRIFDHEPPPPTLSSNNIHQKKKRNRQSGPQKPLKKIQGASHLTLSEAEDMEISFQDNHNLTQNSIPPPHSDRHIIKPSRKGKQVCLSSLSSQNNTISGDIVQSPNFP